VSTEIIGTSETINKKTGKKIALKIDGEDLFGIFGFCK
jgi:hypothetical protein